MNKFLKLKSEHPALFWGGVVVAVIVFIMIFRGKSTASTASNSGVTTAASNASDVQMASIAATENANALAAQTQQASSNNALAATKDQDNTQVLLAQVNGGTQVSVAQIQANRDTTINGQNVGAQTAINAQNVNGQVAINAQNNQTTQTVNGQNVALAWHQNDNATAVQNAQTAAQTQQTLGRYASQVDVIKHISNMGYYSSLSSQGILTGNDVQTINSASTAAGTIH